MNNPLVVFFLDAADIDFCEKFMNAGLMPNLKRFRDNSLFATVQDPDSIVELGTYNVVFTGKSREEIGYYEFRQLVPGTYKIAHDVEGGDFEGEQFWEKLKGTGKKVCILDVFDSKLVPDLEGVQVFNWSVNNMKRATKVVPSTLLNEIPELKTQQLFNQISPATEKQSLQLLQDLLTRLDKKVEVYAEILKKDAFDFIAIGFGELHCAGHQFFDYLEWNKADLTSTQKKRLAGAMEEIFSKFDACLGELLKLVPPHSNKVIMSQTGNFGVYPIESLNEQLCVKLGYQKLNSENQSLSLKTKFKNLLPISTRIKLSRLIFTKKQRDEILSKQFETQTNWKETKVFSIPTMFHTFLRVNLKGREPDGIVLESEYEALVNKICNELSLLTDKKSGKPVYDKIIKVKGVFSEIIPYKLPDIIASLNGFDYFLTEIDYNNEFTIYQSENVFFRSNEHTGLGFVMIQSEKQNIDLKGITFNKMNQIFNELCN